MVVGEIQAPVVATRSKQRRVFQIPRNQDSSVQPLQRRVRQPIAENREQALLGLVLRTFIKTHLPYRADRTLDNRAVLTKSL